MKGCVMENWEDFSTFRDLRELEYVCDILEENMPSNSIPGMLDEITGDGSTLISRLNAQYKITEAICEKVRIGLFQRTWMCGLFSQLFYQLDEVTKEPCLLKSYLSDITLNLHKVLIAAHEIHDDRRREALLADALSIRQRSIAKNPRNRAPSKTGGRALVESVRKESKKRKWNTAWQWLCGQADNRATVGSFLLNEVCENTDTVCYSSVSDNTAGSIKKTTFLDYWTRPDRSKKVGS